MRSDVKALEAHFDGFFNDVVPELRTAALLANKSLFTLAEINEILALRRPLTGALNMFNGTRKFLRVIACLVL